MARSRRRKKNHIPGIFKLLLLIAAAVTVFAVFGKGIYSGWIPSHEIKDLNEWFEVSGDEVRIFLDGEVDFEAEAYAADDTVYLNFDYVHDSLNSRFYLSTADNMVSYTLPDGTVDLIEDTELDGAKALICREDGSYWMSVQAVAAWTDISIDSFAGAAETAKRIFITRGGSEILRAELSHAAALRTEPDITSPVLAELAKDDGLTVKQDYGKWSLVVSDKGIAGYVLSRYVTEPVSTVTEHSYTEPEVSYTLMSESPVVGWHGVYNASGNANLNELLDSAGDHINVIAPTWIQLTGSDGAYVNYSSRDYVDKAHAEGLMVWAVMDNFNQPGVTQDFNTGSYFASAANRRGMISRLMSDAVNYDYDGLNIDFEGLARESGESFIQFIRELSVSCREHRIILSVDNYVPYDFNDFYRLDEQGVFADYVAVMLYDEHTSDPGPNASLSYVRYGLDETAADVPAERIIAGLGFYTRLWTTENGQTSAKTLSLESAAQYADEHGMELSWDNSLGQYYGELNDGGALIQLWLEDENSLAAKMAVVRECGAGGTAVWRLGYDTDAAWQAITGSRN